MRAEPDVPPCAHLGLEITPTTEAWLQYLDVVDGIARRSVQAAQARAKGPNSPSEEDVRLAVWAANEERHQAGLKIRVTPDLPEDVMIHALLHRLHVEDERRWTARVRALGGPACGRPGCRPTCSTIRAAPIAPSTGGRARP